ncbi:WD repeat-containing protein [Actinidia chinensis var. chinensis]|uniref:WD repeat-containing protein n=1 Tax=Actinidia chinensis var. chinensis TaxID=1590841 RepID=A0A2R6QCV8_ACTCC|nr:WD repeat-containing protein [Actinidia chinensis var. chinensis]
MIAAAFSADGSVLAVAGEIVITLWDPEMNVLATVIGDSLEPIGSLSFVGKSNIVSTSRGSNPRVSVWSMSKLSITWSYKLHAEAITCAQDGSSFAVLACLPESSEVAEAKETMLQSKDGAILLFKVGDPVPVAFVKNFNLGILLFMASHQSPT